MNKIENITKEYLFIEMYRFNKLFSEMIEERCKLYNINQVQLYILGLTLCSNKTVSDLAKDLKLTKSAISQAICGLMIKRLIIRKQNPNDRKMFYIVPTDSAQKITTAILGDCSEKYTQIEQSMGKENLNIFVELLFKFNQVINDVV